MRRTAVLLTLATIASIQQCVASPIGLWKAHDDAIIQIKACGHNLCGFVVSTHPNLSTRKPDYSDRYNEDADKRHRSRIGIEILISMKPNGRSKWSGQLYSDRNGHTYSGDLIELNASQIRIDGCWLVLCGGEILNRKKE